MRGELVRGGRIIEQRGIKQFFGDALRSLAEEWFVPRCVGHFRRQALDGDDLERIAGRDGTFFDHYDTPERHVLDLPETPYGYSDEERERMRALYGSGMSIGAPYVCELSDVELLGPEAIPAKGGGYVFENALESMSRLTLGYLSALRRGQTPLVSAFRTPTRRLDCVVSLVGPWNRNYTHWFQDYLARLEGLEHFQSETGTRPDVLVPADASEWMRDSLRAMGVDRDRWIGWRGGRVHVDRLIVPAVRRESSDAPRRALYSPTLFRWIRDRVTSNLDPERTRPHSSHIYISRADATVRRVTNEEATMDLLSEWGFRRYRLAELSYAEQVTLFSDADAIVSPHGSGLLNQIYADDATVIEIFGQKHSTTNPAIEYYIADLWGHDYGCLQGDPVGCDTRVDLDGLEILLERMLG